MLGTKKLAVATALIAVLAFGVALAIDKRPDSPGPGSSSEDLVVAAREAYEAAKLRRRVEPEVIRVNDLYVWSKRWMTAEWDFSLHSGVGAKGVKEHLERIVDLENLTIQLHKVGLAHPDELAAAKYYRIEAELMAARVGG